MLASSSFGNNNLNNQVIGFGGLGGFNHNVHTNSVVNNNNNLHSSEN
jgi:hypothetical protein